jgi:allophanate hydrolase
MVIDARGPSIGPSVAEILVSHAGGSGSPTKTAARVADAIAARGDDGTWLSSVPRVQLLATAEKIEKHPGAKTLPLYGIPFAVKDSIDVEGVPTTLSCPGYAYVVSSTARSVLRDRLRCLLISAGREGPG